MKKAYLTLLLLTILFQKNSQAQINYEATYNHNTVEYPVIKYYNHTSPKWLVVSGDTISLYNLDHSVYRQFPNYCGTSVVEYLSDNLFDTDSTNFEYVCKSGYSFKIYREDGTLLFSRDSAWLGGMAAMADLDFQQSIFP